MKMKYEPFTEIKILLEKIQHKTTKGIVDAIMITINILTILQHKFLCN